MAREISLFSGYDLSENRTTNYCLLMLKMFYEENPKLLSDVLSSLFGENLGNYVGVKFFQQQRRGKSVPDGLIQQAAFTIYIETKNYAWFYDEQLETHLQALSAEPGGFKILMALANFDSPEEMQRSFSRIRELCRTRFADAIAFNAVGFQDFLVAIKRDGLPKNLADVVLDFEAYLNEKNLLPSWGGWLDVVNCAQLPDDLLVGMVYMCPAEGGAYSHSRCRYFGMYRNKKVERVAEIEAVVDVLSAGESELKWKNVAKPDAELKAYACNRVAELRPDAYPTRVFVLGELHETNFEKDAPGGMMASKQYFYVGRLGAEDAASLARGLDGKVWSDPIFKPE